MFGGIFGGASRMSKDLWLATKHIPMGSLFYGGAGTGNCLQLTKLEDDKYQYVTIPVKYIPYLIRKLEKVVGGDLGK